MEKLTITVDEMAKTIGVSRPTAYQLINRADFPSVRIGRRIVIPVADLEKWLSRQAEAPDSRHGY